MVAVTADLVHETTTVEGTGNATVAAVNGKQRFSTAFGTGATTNVFYYYISHRTAAEWEQGTGHMSAASTLVRDTVVKSSNSNNAVNFSAGTKDVTSDIAAVNALGARVYLASGTVANAATLDIVLTAYTAYRAIEIVLTGFQPVTDQTGIYCRTSTDGGANYDAGASDYKWVELAMYPDATEYYPAYDAADGTIAINATASLPGNAATESTSVVVKIFNQTSTAFYTVVRWDGVTVDFSGGPSAFFGSAIRAAAADVNAIRFYFGTGNIDEGNYAVYGIL